MGMLLRRRIHEMQNEQLSKEINHDDTKISDENFNLKENVELNDSSDVFSYDDLNVMTVKQIKEIAQEKGYVITKIIKDEVISEFLSQQQ